MAYIASENQLRVIKFVQELLLDTKDHSRISPALIAEKMDMVISMQPAWGADLDRDAVTDELIRRFSLWVGEDTTLREKGHERWLTTSRKRDWRYWTRYRDWLESNLSWAAVDALDRSTDTILGMLGDPSRDDAWDRRGLVVGHVQSGKTSNYSGLICKSADAGYKIIIVLAGLHNNLRSQTQIRLDESFLGFVTTAKPDTILYTGVGKNGRDAIIKPNCATNRANNGDFNKRVARHLAITPEQRPWLFVVKKNKTVLNLLLSWIRNHAANAVDKNSGREIVTHLPLLMIDDEADHASVDTGEQLFNESGAPDEDHQPKAINSLIRKILHSFKRKSYVGYTATPFANIFIHERGATREEGPDLFPSAFIHNLAASSDYIGPSKVFGSLANEGSRYQLPLVRVIDDQGTDKDFEDWMPINHKNGHKPSYLGRYVIPPSLVTALDSFVISCALRSLRGQPTAHCSMLVHVTRYTNVQEEVGRQVEEHIRCLRQRILRGIDHEGIIERLKKLWETDYCPTFSKLQGMLPNQENFGIPEWQIVEEHICQAIGDIEVRMINGTAKDALDYSEAASDGLKIIAIGGDKLARGLTLEGLCVSYFLRASKMYDTLMQMGRWFGYRPKYLDLCRLFTTRELSDWFVHIADSAEQLREEFDLMAASGATPREYGLKVQSHPTLLVTSKLKMRTARNLELSFSGQLLETVVFYRDKPQLESNLRAATTLIEAIEEPSETSIRRHRGTSDREGYIWRDVSAEKVIDFLTAYKTHPAAIKVNSLLLAEFITKMGQCGELASWTVAFVGGGTGASHTFAPRITLKMSLRSGERRLDQYSIGRLLDPQDEAIDLTDEQWRAALAETIGNWKPDSNKRPPPTPPVSPNGPAIRSIRGFGAQGVSPQPEKGLLILYAIDPAKAFEDDPDFREFVFPKDTPPVIGFAISFPGSNSGMKVPYKVNNVLWEREYGPAD